MRDKYLVKIYNSKNELIREIILKTKNEIKKLFDIDIPVINQIIKLTNNEDYKLKKSHVQYKELYSNLKIHLITPQLKLIEG